MNQQNPGSGSATRRRHAPPADAFSGALTGQVLARLSRRGLLLGMPAALLGLAAVPARADTPASGTAPAALGELAPTVGRAVVVTGRTSRSTRATVGLWQRGEDGTWSQVRRLADAWVGAAGFAAPGAKREGDRKTPSGAFTLPLAFGTHRPTGLALPWHQLQVPYDGWVDDPASAQYNRLVDRRRLSPAVRAATNPLLYPLAGVIGVNLRRVPGRGSALFVHPTRHRPTLGCISLPLTDLTDLLLFAASEHDPRIIVGTAATLTDG